MSRKKWDTLPPQAKKALEANMGEDAVRDAAKHFAAQAQRARDAVAKLDNHKIVALTPEQSAVWKQKLSPITAEWAKERPGADKAVEEFQKIYQQVKAGR